MKPALAAGVRAVAAVALGAGGLLGVPASASAAKLVGGSRQAAIHRAFLATRAHRGQLIVSTRVSTVAPAWAIVTSVRPDGGGRGRGLARPIRLGRSFYRHVGGAERPGAPPAAARADLLKPFAVAVSFSGSGRESVRYRQTYTSVCAGQGGFTDQQTDTVGPMSWRVRYVVHPDDLLAAVRTSRGTTLVPSVGFSAAGSQLNARQTLSRTTVDVGCAGNPTTFRCTMTYALRRSAALLSFPVTGGLEIGVPTSSKATGNCDPNDYTLGPSRWDGGATTAVSTALGVVGGRLPNNPYAPIRVSWPGGSLAGSDGFTAGPCQGDGAACTDAFSWRGEISLGRAG